MNQLLILESLVILVIAIILYGLPIALVVYLVISLKRIRSDQKMLRNKIEEIEHLLLKEK